MRFVLLFHGPIRDLDRALDDPESATYWESWRSYMGAMHQAGIARGGLALRSLALATTVRTGGGRRQVQDGPFADTKELLGGFLEIDVPTLDEAITWAARCPGDESWSTEIRPVLPMEG